MAKLLPILLFISLLTIGSAMACDTLNSTCTPCSGGWNSTTLKYTENGIGLGYNWNTDSLGLGDITGWDVSCITDMQALFHTSTGFNQDISSWDVSNITVFSNMFQQSQFNQNINSWDVSSGVSFNNMFYSNTVFNQDLYLWDVSSGTNFASMFDGSPMSQDLRTWCVSGIGSTPSNFDDNIQSLLEPNWGDACLGPNYEVFDLEGAPNDYACDGPTGSVSKTNGLEKQACTDYCNAAGAGYSCCQWMDPSIGGYVLDNCWAYPTGSNSVPWDDVHPGEEAPYHYSTEKEVKSNILNSTYTPCSGGWNGTSLESAFYYKDWSLDTRYGDITGWDTSCIDSLKNTFYSSTNFNQDIGSWNTSNVGTLEATFLGVNGFANSLDDWDTSNVISFYRTFENSDYNEDIGSWDTGNGGSFGSMFKADDEFNQDIGDWDLSNATNLFSMFQDANGFNQDIGDWDVSGVSNFGAVFALSNFNQDISDWDVSSGTSFTSMLRSPNFNQDLYKWNTSSATNMAYMFRDSNMSYDLRDWCVPLLASLPTGFVDGAPIESMAIGAYDLLPDWGNCPGTPLDKFNTPCGGGWPGTSLEAQFLYRDFTSDNRYGIQFDEWNVSCIDDMRYSFAYSNFNQDIGDWDVTSVEDASGAFTENTLFNQDIGLWDLRGLTEITDLNNMFNGATSFNQNLRLWCLPNIRGETVIDLSAEFFSTTLAETRFPVPGACYFNPPTITIEDYEVLNETTVKYRVRVDGFGAYDNFTGRFYKNIDFDSLSTTFDDYNIEEDTVIFLTESADPPDITIIVDGVWYHEYTGLLAGDDYNFTFCDINNCLTTDVSSLPQIISINATTGVHNVSMTANYTEGLYSSSALETYFKISTEKMCYNVTGCYVEDLYLGTTYPYSFCVDYGPGTVCSQSTFTTLTNENELDDVWDSLLQGNGTAKTILGFVVLLGILFFGASAFGRFNISLGTYGFLVLAIIGSVIATLMNLFSIGLLLLIIIVGVIFIILKNSFFNQEEGR